MDLIGCRQMPASLRDDSSLADPSLAFGALNRGSECSENGGPSCSHRADLSFLPREEQQGGALQTFFRDEKNREQFACAAASALLAYGTWNRPALLP